MIDSCMHMIKHLFTLILIYKSFYNFFDDYLTLEIMYLLPRSIDNPPNNFANSRCTST